MNPFPDGGGGNDHILLTRGDVPPIYTVEAWYNDRLHRLRGG